MIRRPPRSTRTDTLFPYTTLFRSRDETNRVYSADPYLQASWDAAPRWTVDAGRRYSTVSFDDGDHYVTAGNPDDSGHARYLKLLPMAALRYAPSEASSLCLSYGRGFETPTLNELSYRADGRSGLNFALQPALSDNVEAGTKWPTSIGRKNGQAACREGVGPHG